MKTMRSQAVELRKKGYSYSLIHQKLGVSKSTMHYWLKDVPYVPNKFVTQRIRANATSLGIKRHIDRLEEIKKLQIEGENEVGKLSNRDIWMLGLGLYIGEGAKSFESIRISNSDPTVIRLAMRWLRDICDLNDDNFSVRLHIYPDINESEALLYWQKVTGLKQHNFRKTSVDARLNKALKRQGKLKYGTAHISIVARGDRAKGVQLYRKLNGWMAGALSQV